MEEAEKRPRWHNDSADQNSPDDDMTVWALLDEQFRKNTNIEEYCREVFIPRIFFNEAGCCFDTLQIVFQYLKKLYAERNFSLLQLAIYFLPSTDKACLFISTLKHEVNVRGPDGETALFLAVRLNKLLFVKQLAEDGADFGLQNNSGEAAIMVARQLGDLDMISFVHLKSAEVESLSGVLFPASLRLR